MSWGQNSTKPKLRALSYTQSSLRTPRGRSRCDRSEFFKEKQNMNDVFVTVFVRHEEKLEKSGPIFSKLQSVSICGQGHVTSV